MKRISIGYDGIDEDVAILQNEREAENLNVSTSPSHAVADEVVDGITISGETEA